MFLPRCASCTSRSSSVHSQLRPPPRSPTGFSLVPVRSVIRTGRFHQGAHGAAAVQACVLPGKIFSSFFFSPHLTRLAGRGTLYRRSTMRGKKILRGPSRRLPNGLLDASQSRGSTRSCIQRTSGLRACPRPSPTTAVPPPSAALNQNLGFRAGQGLPGSGVGRLAERLRWIEQERPPGLAEEALVL